MLEVIEPTSIHTPPDQDELVHIVCECDPRFSLCGMFDENGEEVDDGPECPDCLAAEPYLCPRCGT